MSLSFWDAQDSSGWGGDSGSGGSFGSSGWDSDPTIPFFWTTYDTPESHAGWRLSGLWENLTIHCLKITLCPKPRGFGQQM